MAKKLITYKKEILNIEDIKATMKALEKISSVDLRYLKIASQELGNYERYLKRIFSHILKEKEKPFSKNRLFRSLPLKKRLNVILTSQKGLCAGLFNRLIDKFEKNMTKEKDDILVVGERGRKILEERKIDFKYFFPAEENIPGKSEAEKISRMAASRFLEGSCQEIVIFWPAFINFFRQTPREVVFLPIKKEKFEKEVGEEESLISDFPIFEPNTEKIVIYLIKEYLNIVFYQKILETKLCELSARTNAMEEAGGKADDLIKKLNLEYFRSKREMVTKEITDLFSHRILCQRN
jgi:ATP synthase F1 gamma subunit